MEKLTKPLLYILMTVFLIAATEVHAGESTDLLQTTVYMLRPTQGSVGLMAAQAKAKRFSEFSKKELKDYLDTHPIPVVIGPGGEYYMIDHHHLSRALLIAGFKNVFIKVIADWSQYTVIGFWRKMKEAKYTYLLDSDGSEIKPADLPLDVADLKDDPFRSLAYFAREKGAFIKTTIPFAEFYWAEFYRHNISLDALKNKWKKSVEKAVEMSTLPEAAGLPGYRVTCEAILSLL